MFAHKTQAPCPHSVKVCNIKTAQSLNLLCAVGGFEITQ